LLGGNFNPRNISHMPAVKISARLKLDENIEGTSCCPSISGWTRNKAGQAKFYIFGVWIWVGLFWIWRYETAGIASYCKGFVSPNRAKTA
jgi:hypothetical protein